MILLDRREINEKFTDLDEDTRWDKYKDEGQISNRIMRLLMKFRKRLIKPERTPKADKQGLAGGEVLNTGIDSRQHNPTNNLIYRHMKEDELRAEHALELSIIKFKGEVFLGKEGTNAKADSIVLAIHCFKLIVRVHTSCNLSSLTSFNLECCMISFYIFYTARDASINGNGGDCTHSFHHKVVTTSIEKVLDNIRQHTPGRPVLRHTKESPLYRHASKSDGSIITRKQMVDMVSK